MASSLFLSLSRNLLSSATPPPHRIYSLTVYTSWTKTHGKLGRGPKVFRSTLFFFFLRSSLHFIIPKSTVREERLFSIFHRREVSIKNTRFSVQRLLSRILTASALKKVESISLNYSPWPLPGKKSRVLKISRAPTIERRQRTSTI